MPATSPTTFSGRRYTFQALSIKAAEGLKNTRLKAGEFLALCWTA